MASPAPTPVASPFSSTVATISSELDHVNDTSATAMPSAVAAIASNCCVAPASITASSGPTVTVDTTGSGGGGSVTVSVAVPETPSAVAVIMASPAPTPVASPFSSTVATISSELDHVNDTSATAMPSAVAAIASNCCVAPASIAASSGLTVTVDTTGSGGGGGSATLIVTGELAIPSAVARTEVVPAPTAVATPAEVMVTTLVSLLDQVKLTSPRTAPPAVRAVAVKVIISPIVNAWVEEGEIVTRDTGAWLTVTGIDALPTPFPVARIVADPTLTPVATPPELMVTTAVLLLDQVKSTPLITAPSEALAVATNLCVLPTSIVAVFGLTSTTETVGAGGGVGGGVGVAGSDGLVGEESSPPHPAYRKPPAETNRTRHVVIDLNDIQPPCTVRHQTLARIGANGGWTETLVLGHHRRIYVRAILRMGNPAYGRICVWAILRMGDPAKLVSYQVLPNGLFLSGHHNPIRAKCFT